jgi:hypothetical protein
LGKVVDADADQRRQKVPVPVSTWVEGSSMDLNFMDSGSRLERTGAALRTGRKFNFDARGRIDKQLVDVGLQGMVVCDA